MKRITLASRRPDRGSLLESLRHAAEGVGYAIRAERNTRLHGVIAALVILIGLVSSLSFSEWALLLLSIGIVLAGEMFNTAIELVVDMIEPHDHPLAAHAKDVAAGATLVLAITAAAVGIVVLLPKVWARFFN